MERSIVNAFPRIAVIDGGISEERAVSLESGKALAEVLRLHYPVDRFHLEDSIIPGSLVRNRHVVFPVLHGTFGEDGGFQEMLEKEGFCYAGSDAAASRLCFNKTAAKERVAAEGIRVADDIVSKKSATPPPGRILERLGESIVIKPVAQGSSIGLSMVEGERELCAVLDDLGEGEWLFEKRIRGREISVGILEGKAMGLVEISPEGGVYDYAHKYTDGFTRYDYPAEVNESVAETMRAAAGTAFQVCGCRDFARVDFILSDNLESYFLEINTLPGLTATSLLPKSASCRGLDFSSLARRLADPAMKRFLHLESIRNGEKN